MILQKLTTGLLLLSSLLSFSQNNKVVYSGYIPLNTKHYEYNKHYTKNEGGRYGLILSRKVVKENYYTETSFGALENSFGKLSVVAIQSVGKDIFGVSTSVGVGFCSGYKILYKNGDKVADFPKILKETGILPYIGLNLSLSKGIKITDKVNITPLVIINPTFVNSGIRINLE